MSISPSAVPALEVENLKKTYPNGVEALKGISLSVAPGDFYALLGPNGAGKSTLIGCVTADRLPDAGAVRICGADPFADMAGAAACLGYVTEQPFLYPEVSVAELLRFVAAARGLDDGASRDEAARLLALLGCAAPRPRSAASCRRGWGARPPSPPRSCTAREWSCWTRR